MTLSLVNERIMKKRRRKRRLEKWKIEEKVSTCPSKHLQEHVVNRFYNVVFFAKLIKKALGKSSSDEEQDGTDTDQHDSLPYDNSKQTSKDVASKPVSKTNSGERPEIHTLQGIISKWSIRRNSHRGS